MFSTENVHLVVGIKKDTGSRAVAFVALPLGSEIRNGGHNEQN
jgi:hypothetical protein